GWRAFEGEFVMVWAMNTKWYAPLEGVPVASTQPLADTIGVQTRASGGPGPLITAWPLCFLRGIQQLVARHTPDWGATDIKPTPMAELSDGCLDLVVVRDVSKLVVVNNFLKMEDGSHMANWKPDEQKGLEYYKVRAFRLEPKEDEETGSYLVADGECIGKGLNTRGGSNGPQAFQYAPVDCVVHPSKIRMFCSHKCAVEFGFSNAADESVFHYELRLSMPQNYTAGGVHAMTKQCTADAEKDPTLAGMDWVALIGSSKNTVPSFFQGYNMSTPFVFSGKRKMLLGEFLSSSPIVLPSFTLDMSGIRAAVDKPAYLTGFDDKGTSLPSGDSGDGAYSTCVQWTALQLESSPPYYCGGTAFWPKLNSDFCFPCVPGGIPHRHICLGIPRSQVAQI
ncbi:hypothetical protein CYMTET_23207, partial [Cymbomonas tetramitiformis]